MNSNDSERKNVLFISELPNNIIDSKLQEFFADY